jgi:uncharacterized protein (TIGR02646 family)
MIRVIREAEPRSLRENSVAWGQELCNARFAYYQDLAKYTRGEISLKPKKPDAVKGRYASQGVKNALDRTFSEKCCYCESKMKPASYPHIEHFRPQSIYPKLAYQWTNLLYACEQCNSGHKGNQFPLAPNEETGIEVQDEPCRRDETDNGLIIDPCREDPIEYFSYYFTEPNTAGDVDVVLVCLNRRAEISRDVFGLDRDDLNDAHRIYLRRVRSDVELYLKLKRFSTFSGNFQGELQNLLEGYILRLRELMDRRSPYSAMARAYLLQECGADF